MTFVLSCTCTVSTDVCILHDGTRDCRSKASTEPEATEPSLPFVWPIGDVGELTEIGDDTFHDLGATFSLHRPYYHLHY